jgi:DNA-binding PadR family transcriptional regulator
MTLEYAILGLLNYESLSGYDIKKTIDQTVAHFWPADQSQIYRTLSRMEADGWVRVELVPQQTRPSRKVYHINDTGREHLLGWLSEPIPPGEVRLAWLVQIFFAGRLPDEQIIDLLESMARYHRERLKRYQQIPIENEADLEGEDPRERYFWMLTVDYGITLARLQLNWLEAVIEQIRAKDYCLPVTWNNELT